MCAWVPCSLGNCCSANLALSLLTALNDNAINISSLCKRGLTLPKYSVFKF